MTVPLPKALRFALLAFSQSGFLITFTEFTSFYIKLTVYENEPIKRHQTLLLLYRSSTKSFPPKFVKERYLFSILMFARNSR
ncbi:hypothetical protein ASE92_11850 [Pedobacter sp. Leaf41]|nr:hypothetical protein ASE92_11850 [Pedobacter sp. Leaf41]